MMHAAPIDPAWEAEWTAAYAEPLPARESRSQTSLLEFSLGRQAYALPLRDLSGAADIGPIVPIPGRRERIVGGLFHLDGQLLLVADLTRLLNIAPTANGRGHVGFARMLVFGNAPNTFAIAVDDVPGTFKLAKDLLQPVPATAPPAIARLALGVARRGAQAVTVLDAQRLHEALREDLR